MRQAIFVMDGTRCVALQTKPCILDGEMRLSEQGDWQIAQQEETETISVNGQPLTPFRRRAVDGRTFLLVAAEEKAFSQKNVPEIHIGADSENHICLPKSKVSVVLKADRVTVEQGEVYHNGSRTTGTHTLLEGDELVIDTLILTWRADQIICCGSDYTCTLNLVVRQGTDMEEFPIYKRSPRIIKHPPMDKVEILPPPEKQQPQKGRLARMILPPLVMLIMTITVSIISKRGLFVLISAASMLMTLVFSVTTFFGERKDNKQKEKDRIETYNRYLLSTRKRLHRFKQQNEEALTYHYPSVQELEHIVEQHSSRIYERAAIDNDFLTVSIGTAQVAPDFEISYRMDELRTGKDPLREQAEAVLSHFRSLEDMPVRIDLKRAHLGIVGEKRYIQTQLQALLAQLCVMQSYHDIEVITVIEPEDLPLFAWSKWLPHCKVREINISGLITGENQRDQVLGNIAQALKARKTKTEEQKKDTIYLPHYIFIIDNPKLIINHSIMEFLLSADASMGFTMVYTSNIQANLPENIQTVLRIEGSQEGTLVLNEGKFVNQKVKTLDIANVDLERMARTLCPLIHNKGVSTQIPESITFFELYGVRKPEELPIDQLWKTNAVHKSMAVPLGVRAKDDIVYLNLHEKAHGPHGLVAGTTGSGKSEILQSYILSLAVNFHPYEVGFLLIDYKGGGMANLFQNLPHLLGTITNLDGSESLRALASIKSELARRQRVFNDAGVNSINQYTKRFKAGEVTLPLPHLLLISDEFAELKKEQPDFMSELVSTARIGRSLGVHLILATQKPSGVVDDQIWSNSKFKLALKVQDESDSKEVLKTPDAARITQPGRAYLQVGNNEVYELFQSAWSGAEYTEKRAKQSFDGRIYLLNDLGQGQLLNQDLSVFDQVEESKLTQLDVAVDQIKKCYDAQQVQPVEKPWLPPLAGQIVAPHIEHAEVQDAAQFGEYDLAASLGVIDIPEEQKQVDYVHDFIRDGNFAIFGASGFGKSTVEVEIALSLALKNSPEKLKYFILDLGNAALGHLRGLPHTADYLSFDDVEKLQKLVKLINEELRERKRLFAKENAVNFVMYNSVAAKPLPAILLFVDNYDVVKEMGFDFEEFFTKLTRDGTGVGIYTIITATRGNAVRYATMNNFKNRIAQFMFDSTDYLGIVGRSKYQMPEVKGRALVKHNKDVSVMQCYLPAPCDDDVAYANRIGELVNQIREKNTAPEAVGIKTLPEILTMSLLQKFAERSARRIPIALDTENVEVQYIEMSTPLYLIVGASQTGKTNLLHLVRQQCEAERIFVADSQNLDLQDCEKLPQVTYMSGAEDAEPFIKELAAYAQARQQLFTESGAGKRPKEFFATLPSALILIDDTDRFIEVCKAAEKELEEALRQAMDTGITVICTSLPGRLRGYDNVTKILKDTQNGIVLGNPADQMMLPVQAPRGYKAQQDRGFFVRRGEGMQIQLPKAAEEGEEI